MFLQRYSTDYNGTLQNAMLFKPLYPCPPTKGNKNILLYISHLHYTHANIIYYCFAI